jgi:hypothetical protein
MVILFACLIVSGMPVSAQGLRILPTNEFSPDLGDKLGKVHADYLSRKEVRNLADLDEFAQTYYNWVINTYSRIDFEGYYVRSALIEAWKLWARRFWDFTKSQQLKAQWNSLTPRQQSEYSKIKGIIHRPEGLLFPDIVWYEGHPFFVLMDILYENTPVNEKDALVKDITEMYVSIAGEGIRESGDLSGMLAGQERMIQEMLEWERAFMKILGGGASEDKKQP